MIHTIILCTQHPAKLVYIIGILVFILRAAPSGANIEVLCASFGEYEHDIKVKLNNKCSQPDERSELKGDLGNTFFSPFLILESLMFFCGVVMSKKCTEYIFQIFKRVSSPEWQPYWI